MEFRCRLGGANSRTTGNCATHLRGVVGSEEFFGPYSVLSNQGDAGNICIQALTPLHFDLMAFNVTQLRREGVMPAVYSAPQKPLCVVIEIPKPTEAPRRQSE
jgi:hypothetical protein